CQFLVSISTPTRTSRLQNCHLLVPVWTVTPRLSDSLAHNIAQWARFSACLSDMYCWSLTSPSSSLG
ncbi:LOW QUALITY PROTEIN: hypothetical protein PanWU01x14_057890, partial [Parasponia andersonii]